MKSRIPVKNIYYLLAYAWDFVGRGEDDFFGADSFENPTELLARIFDISLAVLGRRGFLKDYTARSERTPGIRGKLLLSDTVTSGSLFGGETICTADEYSYDCRFNQIVKSAVTCLAREPSVTSDASASLRRHLAKLRSVRDTKLSLEPFRGIQFHSHNRHYKFVIHLSQLVCENLAVSNSMEDLYLESFLNKEVEMHRVFETFVRNFYTRELGKGYLVNRENYSWVIGPGDTLFKARLPSLSTDVTINSESEVLVVDAKYYSEALTSRYNSAKYRRDHLSQLMDYMRGATRRHTKAARGMLLYPTVGETIHDRGLVEGFDVTVATIDLSRDWSLIHRDLLSLVQSSFKELQPAS